MKEQTGDSRGSALRSGGISDCEKYLRERYGAEPLLEKELLLAVETAPNLQISGRSGAENCSVAAAARVCEYWCSAQNVKFPHDLADTYQVSEILAASKYKYSAQRGLSQFRIKPLLHELTHRYGIYLHCRLHILWSFGKHMEHEFEAGRPVILNIAFGYYRNHSVTACGLRKYRCGERLIAMLAVADGWDPGIRYIDMHDFRRFPGFKGISSVCTARVMAPA